MVKVFWSRRTGQKKVRPRPEYFFPELLQTIKMWSVRHNSLLGPLIMVIKWMPLHPTFGVLAESLRALENSSAGDVKMQRDIS